MSTVKKKLTDAREEGFCLYIQKMDDIGFPIMPETVEPNANAILARYHSDPDSEPEVTGGELGTAIPLNDIKKKDSAYGIKKRWSLAALKLSSQRSSGSGLRSS
jgi:hypothetical protein